MRVNACLLTSVWSVNFSRVCTVGTETVLKKRTVWEHRYSAVTLELSLNESKRCAIYWILNAVYEQVDITQVE